MDTGPGIIWSCELAAVQRNLRLSTIADGRYRVSISRRRGDGSASLDSRTLDDRRAAVAELAALVLAVARTDYAAAETSFVTDFKSFRDGRRGFRPGSGQLRRQAEAANARLFAVISDYARAWNGLDGDLLTAESIAPALPDWLAQAVSDLRSQGALAIVPLDEWVRRNPAG